MAKYLVGDMKATCRDACVAESEEMLSEMESNYSGYYVVENLGDISIEEANILCQRYNDYIGEPDVECSCCSEGCIMSAFEYAHMTGCAYSGT